jgi:hypothetical protein
VKLRRIHIFIVRRENVGVTSGASSAITLLPRHVSYSQILEAIDVAPPPRLGGAAPAAGDRPGDHLPRPQLNHLPGPPRAVCAAGRQPRIPSGCPFLTSSRPSNLPEHPGDLRPLVPPGPQTACLSPSWGSGDRVRLNPLAARLRCEGREGASPRALDVTRCCVRRVKVVKVVKAFFL